MSKTLLNEIKKAILIANTDQKRIRRAKYEVRTRPPKVIILDEKNQFVDANFKAFPSKEDKRHYLYVVYNPKDKDIKEAYCDCLDFCYRLYRPYERAKILRPDKVPKKFTDHAAKIPTKAWTKKTNPTGKLFLCKHLMALTKYL